MDWKIITHTNFAHIYLRWYTQQELSRIKGPDNRTLEKYLKERLSTIMVDGNTQHTAWYSWPTIIFIEYLVVVVVAQLEKTSCES